MKTMYQSDDGKLFSNKDECIRHENEWKFAQQNQKLLNDIKVTLNEVNMMVAQVKANTGMTPKYTVDQGRLIIYFEGAMHR